MAAEKHQSTFQSGALDLGKPDSLRHHVLSWVLHQNYDKAIEKLKEYIETGSDYPEFVEKTSRYVGHCVDLVHAIKAKRHFPGIDSLTYNKQKELAEKYRSHVMELQNTLKRIEIIYENLRIHDVRSTVYVIKAVCVAGFGLVLAAFALECYRGLASTSNVVFIDLLDQLVGWIFS